MTEETACTAYDQYDHTTIINAVGVQLIGYPHGWGARFEPRAAIAHAEYILSQRERLEQLQQHLEATWRGVAQEVKERFEASDPDGTPFAEASDNDIERILQSVAGCNKNGYFTGQPTSPAGEWYRSMWNEDGSDSTTFEQQWTPFLRVCYELQQPNHRQGTR